MKCTRCGKTRQKYHETTLCQWCRNPQATIPDGVRRCLCCEIFIFSDENEAALFNITYCEAVNKAHKGLCPGCHHSDRRRKSPVEYTAAIGMDATISLRGLR